jgi:hypothetical protein
MPVITLDSLMSLEVYARVREEFRAKVIAHKKIRTIHLGRHVTLLFEDELTLRYQVQEMLRIERIFEEQGIREELGAYNPLVPDGSNWKATMLIEYEEVEVRKQMLSKSSASRIESGYGLTVSASSMPSLTRIWSVRGLTRRLRSISCVSS